MDKNDTQIFPELKYDFTTKRYLSSGILSNISDSIVPVETHAEASFATLKWYRTLRPRLRVFYILVGVFLAVLAVDYFAGRILLQLYDFIISLVVQFWPAMDYFSPTESSEQTGFRFLFTKDFVISLLDGSLLILILLGILIRGHVNEQDTWINSIRTRLCSSQGSYFYIPRKSDWMVVTLNGFVWIANSVILVVAFYGLSYIPVLLLFVDELFGFTVTEITVSRYSNFSILLLLIVAGFHRIVVVESFYILKLVKLGMLNCFVSDLNALFEEGGIEKSYFMLSIAIIIMPAVYGIVQFGETSAQFKSSSLLPLIIVMFLMRCVGLLFVSKSMIFGFNAPYTILNFALFFMRNDIVSFYCPLLILLILTSLNAISAAFLYSILALFLVTSIIEIVLKKNVIAQFVEKTINSKVNL